MVVTQVDALTKRNGEEYLDFVARARAHPLGREVKGADVLDRTDMAGPNHVQITSVGSFRWCIRASTVR